MLIRRAVSGKVAENVKLKVVDYSRIALGQDFERKHGSSLRFFSNPSE
jgi:hypothetical protein